MPSPRRRGGATSPVPSAHPSPLQQRSEPSPFFLTTAPSSCTHGTSTLESPREAAVGEAGDDQLADGRDRSFGAGRRGALDAAPLRRRARSLRSELAVPDAGRAGARA